MEPIAPSTVLPSPYSPIGMKDSVLRKTTVITSMISDDHLLIAMSDRQDENNEESGSEISPKSCSTEPERRKKKPYKELTLEEKVQLIKLAEENAGMSQASIAERYAIAKSNVCRILQRKKEYLRAYESAGFAGSRKRKLKGVENLPSSADQQQPREGLLAPQPQRPDNFEGNETLRAHMYKQHGISRMFMCRCCNWAFPDKTSLHMHIQAKDEGKNVSVPVIGKGLVPGGPEMRHHSSINHMGPLMPGPMIPPGTQLDSSAFSPLHPTVNNNTLPHSVGVPHHGQVLPAPVPIFSGPPGPHMTPPSDELIARVRERLMLNSLIINQNGFGLAAAWINNQFPNKPNDNAEQASFPEVPVIQSSSDEVINVEKGDDEQPSTHKDKESMASSSSDNEEQKSEKREEHKRRSVSPAEGGSSTDGSSPAHTRTCASPLDTSTHSTTSLDIFKKDSGSPSAFHPMLKVEQPTAQYPDDVSIHVSPSDSHSTVSPSTDRSHNTHCFECTINKGRLNVCESRCHFLEGTHAQMQNELIRIRSAALSNETVARTLEQECRGLREHNGLLRRKIIECQEQALIFAQSPERCNNPQSVQMFLNSLIQATMLR